MKFTARSMIVSLSLLVALTMVVHTTASHAQAPAKSLKEALAGHWQLVSVTANERTPYGANPHGSMFLDAGGHFSVIVISAGNARNISYFGTYTVNDADKSMTMHIEDSSGGSGESAAGRDVKRLIILSGDDLLVQSEAPSGARGAVKLTWKQAN